MYAAGNEWANGEDFPPDFWDMDKERVFLVGAGLKSGRNRGEGYSVQVRPMYNCPTFERQ